MFLLQVGSLPIIVALLDTIRQITKISLYRKILGADRFVYFFPAEIDILFGHSGFPWLHISICSLKLCQ